MWLNVALDLSFILLIFTIGAFLYAWILGKDSVLYILGLGYPVGAGLFTWVLFLLSWMGLRLERQAIAITGVALLLILALPQLIWRRRMASALREKKPQYREDQNTLSRIVLIILIILFSIALVLAIGRSYSTWDAIAIWSVKGYGIANGGSIFSGETWGVFGLTYPLNIPLQIAAFKNISGDLLPESKLIFPLFFASLIIGCYRFFRRQQVRETIAILGSLFIATLPIAFEHSTSGYANLPFTTYLVLGILYAIQGIFHGNTRHQLLSGILLGLACWTRPEGILVLPFVIIGAVLSIRLSKQGKISWMVWLLPSVVLAGSWLIFARIYASESLILSTLETAGGQLGAGQLNLDAFYRIARFMVHQLLRPSVWGVVLLMSIPLIVLNRNNLRPRSNPEIFSCMLMGLCAAAATTIHFYLISFLGTLASWLPTSANRMFLPTGILLLTWVILLSGKDEKSFVSPMAESAIS
jgi:hypothetical protein